jgi:MFS family permease
MAADRRRWWILALGMSAQAASCVFLYGLPYLIPDLRHQLGLSLTGASTLASAPLAGVIVALVAWGAAADRYGERVVITAGLAIASGGLIAAAQLSGPVGIGVLLACAGAGGASVNAASGRLVLGWFDASERPGSQPVPGARAVAHPRGQHATGGAAVRHHRVRPGVPGRQPGLERGGLAGALTRIAAGKWSDWAGSRLRPMRWLAVVVTAVMGLTALGMWSRSPLAVAALLLAVALSVSTNGLAFTAVAELAGLAWAGRALGVQNTGQNLAAAATPPVLAQLIGLAGYGGAFGLATLFPALAILAIPTRAEVSRDPEQPAVPDRQHSSSA